MSAPLRHCRGCCCRQSPTHVLLTSLQLQTELADLRSQLESTHGSADKAAEKAAADIEKLKQQLHNQMKANQKNSETAARVSGWRLEANYAVSACRCDVPVQHMVPSHDVPLPTPTMRYWHG